MQLLFFKIYFIIFIFSSLSFNIQAQTIVQNNYWLRTYFRIKINEKWAFHSEFDERRLINPDRQLQFITHQHLHYRFGKYTEGVLGASFSAVRQGNIDVPEYRVFQEFHIFKTLGKNWWIGNRFRSEQRFFHNYMKDNLLEGYNHHFRWRLRPQMSYHLGKKWFAKCNDEIMFQDAKFEQNRVYIGIEKQVLKQKIAHELGFMYLYQARSNGGYFQRNIIRYTMTYSLQ